MNKRNMQAVLNAALVFTYILCVFSVGMYEAEYITFKQCMYDFGVYMFFGAINWIAKGLVRRVKE